MSDNPATYSTYYLIMKHTIKAGHVDKFLAAHSEMMTREGLEVKSRSEPDDDGNVSVVIDYTEDKAKSRAEIRLRQKNIVDTVTTQMNSKMKEIGSKVRWHGLIQDDELNIYPCVIISDPCEISVNISKVSPSVEVYLKSVLLEAGLAGFTKTNEDGWVGYWSHFPPSDSL